MGLLNDVGRGATARLPADGEADTTGAEQAGLPSVTAMGLGDGVLGRQDGMSLPATSASSLVPAASRIEVASTNRTDA